MTTNCVLLQMILIRILEDRYLFIFYLVVISLFYGMSYVKKMISLYAIGLLGLVSYQAAAQTERTVTGKVLTANGPLPYAAITLKGTQIGVQADESGAFTFPKVLKEKDVLIISSLAYTDQEFIIKENSYFIEPYLEGEEIIITGALRTEPVARCTTSSND